MALPWSADTQRRVAQAVRTHAVTFERAPARWQGSRPDDIVVGYAGPVEVRDTLAATGFTGRAVTPATLAATLDTAGPAFSNAAGLLRVTAHAGPGLASGVVNVVNTNGPITSGALPHSFIAQPVWYTDLGPNVTVEQSYPADPLLSGWWAAEDGTGGQAQAAGQATIVRGVTDAGNGVVLIGTDPTWRLHAKGLQSQLGRALLWTARP